MIRKTMLLNSTVVLCSVVALFTGVAQATFKKTNAVVDVPGRKSLMVEVQDSSSTQLTFKYKVPDADLITLQEKYEGEPVKRLYLGNAPLIGDEGKPVLPVIPAQFIIPSGKTIASIEIQRNKKKVLAGKHFMEFGKAKIPLIKGAKVRKTFPNGFIYHQDDGYPSQNGTLVSIQDKRGIKIAFVNINPTQYFPKSGKVAVFQEIELKVTLTDEKKNFSKGKIAVRKKGLDPVKMGVENPEALDSYEPEEGPRLDRKSLGICNVADEFSYVLITGQAIRDAKTDVTVNDLIAHRRSIGMTATIVTIEEIFENYQGIDDAEKVRNFIIDAYENWKTEYVVLGGDVSIIPYRNLYEYGEFIPSDLYFQCLNGSYNEDGDTYWGEPTDGPDGTDIDLMSEVSVGRISAETPEEMANFIYKTLAYENMSPTNPYLTHACIAGEFLGEQFGPGEFGFATPYMEEIRLGSEASGYSTQGFISSKIFIPDTMYDNPTSEWGNDSILKIINSDNYSIINHLGHANETYVMKFTNSDADRLTNTNPLFVYSQGCYPGHFPVDCIAEHLTTSNRSGMFAAVFNTVYGYGSYNESKENLDGPSQRFDRQFWDAFFNEYIYKLGDINADSHEDNIWCINYELIRYCMYETVLFGDPSTMLRGLLQGPALAYAGQEISDINGGNNDHICNPGESIDLTVNVQNIGSEASVDASCNLTGNDQYVTIRSSNSELASVSCCGAIQPVSRAFQIDISAGCPTPYIANLSLIITGGDSIWKLIVPVQIYRSSNIHGTVIANTGEEGISGASVFYRGPMTGSVKTGADGSYICQLIEGSYSLWVNASGFLSSDTFEVFIPPAAEVNIRMVTPHLFVEPSSIVKDINIDDSLEVNVTLTNSGDATLLVAVKDHQISKPYSRKKPLRIQGKKEKSNLRYMPEGKNTKIIIPKIYRPGKSLDAFGKVLYLTTLLKDGGNDYFTDGLKSIPAVSSLDVINGQSSTPNLDFLMQYDCVIISANGPWADSELLGDVLADYVDNGHSLIFLVATFGAEGGYQIKGRVAGPDYLPIVAGYGNYNTCNANNFIEHEITANVNFIESSGIVSTTSTQGNGIALGRYGCDNALAVAYNPERPVVAINVFPSDGSWGGDLIQIVSNTIQWGAGDKWLKVNPENAVFSIAPGTSESFTVKLNSLKLTGGLHTGEISLTHNDPSIANPFIIPVRMAVDGFRSLVAEPASVTFDEIWYGNTDTFSVTLFNNGSEATSVYRITSDNANFTCLETAPIKVKARRSASVRVLFNPSHAGHFYGTINIESDAEDNNSIPIQLTGNATNGPSAVVEPTALSFSFQPKDILADKTFVLSNTGAADLTYSVSIRQTGKPIFQMNHTVNPVVRKGMIYNERNYKSPFVENRVIVGLKKGATNFATPNILAQVGIESVVELAKGINPVTKKKSFSTRTVLKLNLYTKSKTGVLEAIRKLSKDPNVEYAEPDYIVKAVNIPNDPLFNRLYGMNNSGQTGGKVDADIDAAEAWDFSTGNSQDVIIGVIDTGVDYLHPDLVENIWKNSGEIPANGIDDDGNGFVDDVYGWDFAYDDNDPMDGHGHGTHCSGTIAAKGNNGIGVAGVMWNARVMAIKFLDDGGYGSTSDAIDAVNYAITMNVPVTSNSWGGGEYSQALEEVIAASGIFVAAAGNSGDDNDLYPHYPSSYELDNIIAVAATDHFDDMAYFSCYGLKSVDLGAPGVEIMSTVPGENYDSYSGTSMATPHVSGAVGLLWSSNPNLSSLDVKNAILQSTDKIPSLQGKTVSGGRLNVQKLLDLAGANWISISPKNPGVIGPSGNREFITTVNPEKLAAGTWNADIVFTTDDPFHHKVMVSIAADVAGCKSIAASEDIVDFGSVWEGRDTVVNISLVNACNDLVTVSEIIFDNPVFSTGISLPAVIKPFGKLEISVNFSPLLAGNIEASVLIISNAEDNPSLDVNLNGICVVPPKITVNPEFLKKSIKFGTVDTGVVSMSNSGGTEFNFKVKAEIPEKIALGDLKNAKIYGISGYQSQILELNPQTGVPIDTITVNTPTGSIYGIAFDGNYIYFATGDTTITVYDPDIKDVVRIITVPGMDYITSVGVSEDYLIVGVKWSDTVYIVDKESLSIVTKWHSAIFGDLTYAGSRNTVIAKGDYPGNIVECELMSGKILNSFYREEYIINIGYSNSAGVLFAITEDEKFLALNPDDGTIVKHYPGNVDIPNGIAADEVPDYVRWIKLIPPKGIVGAGENNPLKIVFSNDYLLPGTYTSDITISHTPGILPDIIVPCTLNVTGRKQLSINPAYIEFPEIWKGRSDSTIIYLVNDGNEATTVSSVLIKNTIFSTNFRGPVTINAFDSVGITVRCTPVKVGVVNDVIKVTSNAANNPLIQVSISATTVAPPKISINPSSLSATMLPGQKANYSLNLKNSGGADYPFKVTIITDETGNPNSGIVYALNDGIVKIDPINGSVIDTVLPYTDGGSCLAFDGKHIYMDTYYSGQIIVIDPDKKQVIDTIDTDVYTIYGIAVTDDKFILSSDEGFHVFDKFSRKQLYSWVLSGIKHDFTYCSHRRSLFLYDNRSNKIFERSVETGAIINSFDTKQKIYALAYSSSMRMLIAVSNHSLNYLNPENGELLGSVDMEFYHGVASDEVNLNGWINSMTRTGVVAKKGVATIGIDLNSSNMQPGQYLANVIVEHEKGWAPGPFVVNCKLRVKAQKLLTVNPEDLTFELVTIGYPKTMPLELINDGNDTTTVKKATSSSKEFRFKETFPVKIPPYSHLTVNVIYSPINTGWDAALLTLKTDASNVSNIIIDARGAGVIPANISINPLSVVTTLQQGMSEIKTLSITNTGGADYPFTLSFVDSCKGVAKTGTGNPADAKVYFSENNYIYQVDPLSGQIIGGGFSLPIKNSITGLAYDGEFIYASINMKLRSYVYILDPDSGIVMDTFNFFRKKIKGLGVGSTILIGTDANGNVITFDKQSGDSLNSWPLPFISSALALSEIRNSVFVFNDSNSVIEERSIAAGTIINSFSFNNSISDCAFSQKSGLLFLTNERGVLYAVDPDNGRIVNQVNLGHTINGLAADEGGLSTTWLTFGVAKGVVKSGNTFTTQLTVSAKELLEGNYAGAILVSPSDNGPGPFTVPCNLIVETIKSASR